MASFKATFSSTNAAVTDARHRVKEFAQHCGFSADDVVDITLAVGEACSNAVQHGPRNGFSIACDFEDRRLSIQIHDSGRGFSLENKGQYVEPRLRHSHGLGIYIMRVLMDEVTYDMTGNGTTLLLVKRMNSGFAHTGGREKLYH